MNTTTPVFVLSRTFDAPRDLVWRAFTEKDHLLQWWGPKGLTMESADLDFRPGGHFHYSMRSPDGDRMWGKFAYREIEPQARIVLINSFSNPEGDAARHPMAADWPLEMLADYTFEERDGKTTITLHFSPHDASDAECGVFEANFGSMTEGFGGTYNKLDAYLAQVQA